MQLRSISALFLRIVGIVLLCLVTCSRSEACSCISPGPPCASYWQADAVFSGKVTAIAEQSGASDTQAPWPSMRRATISIESAFRGVEGKSVELLTGMGGGDCGYNFVSGERYLVYAYRSPRGLIATICSRTRLLKDAAEDIAYIRNLPPAGTGATIKGNVTQISQPFEQDAERHTSKPLGDVVVKITGDGIARDVRTDTEGAFQISGLPAGNYKVRLDLPRSSDDESFTEIDVKVVDRGCADLPFNVHLNGRIGGRVLSPDDQPLAGMKVDVIRAEDRAEAAPKGVWQFSHDDGSFQIDWLPPGIYLVGINLVGTASPSCPFPRTYLPGTADPTKAHEIIIGDNQFVKGVELKLSASPLNRAIEGIVAWPDGKPATMASINITNASGTPWVLSRAVSDESGRFRINAPAGCSVRIHAFTYGGRKSENDNEIIPQRHSEAILVPTTLDPKTPLRLVLTSPGFRHSAGEGKQ